MNTIDQLLDRIRSKQAQVCVIGLGYVGLPLAVEIAETGYKVTGIDTDPQRVASVCAGQSYIVDIDEHRIQRLVATGILNATTTNSPLAEADCVSICVPTPLRKSKDPDISFIVAAVDEIVTNLHPGQLIVLESTTYPGTTEEMILPRLQETGMTVGEDFFLAFSPERVDPGNAIFQTRNTPKILGGCTPTCIKIARCFYEQFIDSVVSVSSPRAAEMVKLLENTFRTVNIALVNEMALICRQLDLDIWEIIAAASSKPFGFMPFFPGPGIGGHCLPVDPHYLSWRLRSLNFQARFIELAEAINSRMPYHVLDLLIRGLNEDNKCLKNAVILVVGVAYKKNINDVRESPGLDLIRLLNSYGAHAIYHDPWVTEIYRFEKPLQSQILTAELLQTIDAALIVTDHDDIDYDTLVNHIPLIVDTRNALANRKRGNARILTL